MYLHQFGRAQTSIGISGRSYNTSFKLKKKMTILPRNTYIFNNKNTNTYLDAFYYLKM